MKVFWPLIAVGWIAGLYPRAVASAKRVQALFDTESALTKNALPEQDLPQSKSSGAPHLELSGVDYTYPGADSPTLTNLSFQLPPGQSLGIVGPTGAGKTTLLLLLGRLLDPTAGNIKSNGADLRSLPLAQVRSALGYVPQDSFLFSVPYEDNIAFGTDLELGPERIAQLIEQVAMTDEVRRFPKGAQTLVGERGVTLSGGQRQRTCIARALAREPKILVLDDCLSAVDTETEQTLLASLRQAGQERGVVIAAHRLSTVAGCDAIIVLNKGGSMEDMGIHEELIKRPGWYQKTWDRQQRRAALGDEE